MGLPHKLALSPVILITLLGAQAWAAAPTIVSLTPASGSGQTQTFTLTASDSDGAADISSIDMLINSTFSKTHACWIYYDHLANRAALASDSGDWNGSTLGPGAPGFSNSQCSVELVSSSDAGNSVSVSFNITFNGSWLGDKIVWGESLDKAKNDSMYQQMGTWTASSSGPAADFTVSATPTHQSTTPGHTASYNVTVTSVNGFTGNVTLTSSYSPDPGGLTVPPAQGAPTSFFMPAGGTFQDTILIGTSSTTTPTDNVTILFTYTDNNLQHTLPLTLTILPATAPTVAISPSSGSGSTQTFNITATDPGGWQAVSGIDFLINSTLDGTHACWFFYQPGAQNNNAAQGILALASDDGSDWSRSVNVDASQNSPPSIQNSQCNVFGGPTTVSGDGNTLTLTITLTFTSSFAGSKNLYVRASDQAGPATDYNQVGTFTTAGGATGPDFSFVTDPTSVTATGHFGASYAINLTRTNGYNGTVNFTVSGIPPGSSLDPAPAPLTPDGGPTSYFLVNVPGTAPTGMYTITVTGTDGTLTHTATAALNFTTAPLPALSASPNSGSGATQTFTFLSTGTAGASPNTMNVLFNSAVDGRAACWMFLGNSNSAVLASDDGSLWTSIIGPTSPTAGNSQCTLSGFTLINNNDGMQVGFTVTITFSHAFAGAKNIYMRGDNSEGGETGYEIVGTWTVP